MRRYGETHTRREMPREDIGTHRGEAAIDDRDQVSVVHLQEKEP